MKYFLTLLLAASSWMAWSQPYGDPISYKKAIGWSPLALIDPFDRSVLLTGSYRLKENLAVLTDAGFIFTSSYLNNATKTRGFQVKPALRFYYGRQLRTFVQLQALYKQVDYSLYDWLGKNCVNEVPAFEQLQHFKFRKKVVGLNIIPGLLAPIGRRWFLEFYAGLGWRYKTQGVRNEPNNCYNLDFAFLGSVYRDNVSSVSIPTGVKLLYRIE